MKQIIVTVLFLTFLYASEYPKNALANEGSPYLQQHVYNPVDWYPWGKEALEKARKENKMIFLSIGYSTCHWCHVMEKESFTDEEVARLLNEKFVSIKVDREEYPQIDKKYQKRYMEVHGKRGGWPLSVFMSPKQDVLHLGTYIPKELSFGSTSMMTLMPHLISLQETNTTGFEKRIEEHRGFGITNAEKKMRLKQISMDKTIRKFLDKVALEFDKENGGFTTRPKFPEASKIALLLDSYKLYGDTKALDMAKVTLKKMAQGGIYDQIGGGFFRYTVDYAWQSPHFEKMLYTNAELVSAYASAYELTGDPLYKKVIDETINQMEENFMEGGLYLAASDADSNGEEGGYFIYEYTEVKEALLKKGMQDKDVEEALAYLAIEEDGNYDGDFSHTHITSDTVPLKLEEVKSYLRSVSAQREFPFVDHKVITSWNAMMIKALFAASKVDKRYRGLAIKRLKLLWHHMRKDGILYHQTLVDKEPKQKALLEDYAFLIDALIEAYGVTYNKNYLDQAEQLTKEAIAQFYKKEQWYLSNDGLEVPADFDDKYYTSSFSLMLENMVRLSSLTEELAYQELAKKSIEQHMHIFNEMPTNISKLVHTVMRLGKGDVIIKASRGKLRKHTKAFDAIKYPFILSKAQESDKYLACRVSSCFAYDTNLTKLIEKINESVGP